MTFLPAKEKDEPLVTTTVRVRQSLVERFDWVAQDAGYSRTEAIEHAMELAISTYEQENSAKAGRIPFTAKKPRRRRSDK